MTDLIETDAPGKLVLIGEYAVLEGAPSIATAVDVRATVSLRSSPGPGSRLSIANDQSEFDFTWTSRGEIAWQGTSAGERGKLLEAAAATLAADHLMPEQVPCIEAKICSSAFYRESNGGRAAKLGLGSSAAVAVAITGALHRLFGAGEPDLQTLLNICMRVHRRFQNGEGSGIDVASCLMGGVAALKLQTEEPPSIEALNWPADLHVVPVWTGVSASTTELLTRSGGFREKSRHAYTSYMNELGDLSTAALTNWRTGHSASILELIGLYSEMLRRYDDESGTGIFSPVHCELLEMSRAHGAVYKPAGAGGGDFGVAFAGSTDVTGLLRKAFRDAGFYVLDAQLAAQGFRLLPNGSQ